ncbi:hypothetical protein F0U60_06105 [Archangium minus]|uniref:Uncharacterized protein n=1 Tax=Archangium minus TaxID=83450 RepID=A0ABY9WJ22_9BACT|nr:hypothetical protein F0U60_06105 [Archangium minus]
MVESPWLWFFPRADDSLHEVVERAVAHFSAAGLSLQPRESPSLVDGGGVDASGLITMAEQLASVGVEPEQGPARHRVCYWALARDGGWLTRVGVPMLEASPEGPRLRFIPEAPLSLELTRHEGTSPASTTARLMLSRVLFGEMAHPLEGLARMFEEDILRLGPWPEVEHVRGVLARAIEEARVLDVAACEWRSRVLEAVETFIADVTRPGEKVLRGPRQYEAPLPLTWPERSQEEWYLEAWVERLSWGAPGEERALAYWKEEGRSPRWEALARLCTAKSTFESKVAILASHDTDESLRELAGFVADPNWPGAALAWSELTRRGARARPALELALRDAEACADTDWRDILLDLLDRLPPVSTP